MGRLLAQSSLGPMGWQWGDSSAKGRADRRAQSVGAKLNSQDVPLQLMRTTLSPVPCHLQPFFWQVEKNSALAEPTVGVHGVFPPPPQNKRDDVVTRLKTDL